MWTFLDLKNKDPHKIKNKGQRKTQDPCPGCALHKNLCICKFIPNLTLQTKVSLIIHHRELKRTTNTGTLAIKALTNSKLFIRGKINEALDLGPLLNENYQSLLFYPSDNAAELTREYLQQFSKPIQLIVPDGNWRQASKVHTRHSELINIPRIMIKSPNQAKQHLRAETASRPEGMATLQAIAEALGIIEGPLAKEALLSLYNMKLEATLIGRGLKLKTGPC